MALNTYRADDNRTIVLRHDCGHVSQPGIRYEAVDPLQGRIEKTMCAACAVRLHQRREADRVAAVGRER